MYESASKPLSTKIATGIFQSTIEKLHKFQHAWMFFSTLAGYTSAALCWNTETLTIKLKPSVNLKDQKGDSLWEVPDRLGKGGVSGRDSVAAQRPQRTWAQCHRGGPAGLCQHMLAMAVERQSDFLIEKDIQIFKKGGKTLHILNTRLIKMFLYWRNYRTDRYRGPFV